MPDTLPLRLAAMALLLLSAPAVAQNYGQQPGYGPNPYQPGPFGSDPGQPNPFQPAPSQPNGQPYGQPFGRQGGGPSIVGTWSGQSSGPNGVTQQADAFSQDGRFMSVARLPNGFLARGWGAYRATPVAPNQLRLETRLEGWLPREVCQQLAGGIPQCQPFQVPTADTSLVTFNGPDQLQSISESNAGTMVNEQRDNQPALLQAQAPQRWVTVVQPSSGPGQAPVVTPYVSPLNRGPATNIPGLGGNCDDLQQRRICMDGTLYRGRDGCLRCNR